MPEAPLPPDEEERIQALQACQILDTEPEEEFDSITQLAAEICEVPISTISLVDRDRQWFKSAFGLAQRETPRKVSFCAHVILTAEPLVIEDAAEDERFKDNPLVSAEPPIRFYAGVPLSDRSRRRLGTLCVIGHEPRSLSDHQFELLNNLARHAEVFIEMKRQIAEVAKLSGGEDGDTPGSIQAGLKLTAEGIRVLKGFATICCHCRNVKDPENSWIPIDKLIERSSLEFSHSICPSCQETHYGDVFKKS